MIHPSTAHELLPIHHTLAHTRVIGQILQDSTLRKMNIPNIRYFAANGGILLVFFFLWKKPQRLRVGSRWVEWWVSPPAISVFIALQLKLLWESEYTLCFVVWYTYTDLQSVTGFFRVGLFVIEQLSSFGNYLLHSHFSQQQWLSVVFSLMAHMY